MANIPTFNIYDEAPAFYDATLSPEFIEQCYTPVRRLVKCRMRPEGTSVLDLCCGTGVMADLLQDLDGLNYLGLDINPEYLDFCRHRVAKSDHFRFEAADLLSHTLSRSFDIVLMVNAYHHFENAHKSNLLKKVRNWLAPDGTVIVYEMVVAPHASPEAFIRANLDYYEKRIAWIRDTEPMTEKKLAAWENTRDLSAAAEDEYKVDYDYILTDFKANGFRLDSVNRVWPPPDVELFENSCVGEFIFVLQKRGARQPGNACLTYKLDIDKMASN